MPISEAKKRNNLKWDRAHRADYWRATVVFPAGEKAAVLAQAAARGLSLSDYVRGLVQADRAAAPVSDPETDGPPAVD